VALTVDTWSAMGTVWNTSEIGKLYLAAKVSFPLILVRPTSDIASSDSRLVKDMTYTTYILTTTTAVTARWRRLETRTWSWADCRNLTPDDTSMRSVAWLLICWTWCHASQFVIVRTRCWNCASEYTVDLAQQVRWAVVSSTADNSFFFYVT